MLLEVQSDVCGQVAVEHQVDIARIGALVEPLSLFAGEAAGHFALDEAAAEERFFGIEEDGEVCQGSQGVPGMGVVEEVVAFHQKGVAGDGDGAGRDVVELAGVDGPLVSGDEGGGECVEIEGLGGPFDLGEVMVGEPGVGVVEPVHSQGLEAVAGLLGKSLDDQGQRGLARARRARQKHQLGLGGHDLLDQGQDGVGEFLGRKMGCDGQPIDGEVDCEVRDSRMCRGGACGLGRICGAMAAR